MYKSWSWVVDLDYRIVGSFGAHNVVGWLDVDVVGMMAQQFVVGYRFPVRSCVDEVIVLAGCFGPVLVRYIMELVLDADGPVYYRGATQRVQALVLASC